MNVSLSTLASPLSSLNPAPATAGQGGFADAIGAAMSQVEGARASATQASTDLLMGGIGDVHTVALAAQKAELSLELFQQVRNKFVSAYQEIMKMPM
jgi:flagellar hook-basal body complex protein FliE